MLDAFDIPKYSGAAIIATYTCPSTVTNTQWRTWNKPRGKSMLSILCIGGGGGGGGGFTGVAAAARGGGGGGGSSAVTRVIVPIELIPDVLFIQVGAGGTGTTSADFAGGGVTAIAGSFLSEQRPATPTAGSVNGSGGPQIWTPFFSFGGCGGSSSNTGIGGWGGNGAYGSGGGGGGGGTTGGTGGAGGSGIVILTAW